MTELDLQLDRNLIMQIRDVCHADPALATFWVFALQEIMEEIAPTFDNIDTITGFLQSIPECTKAIRRVAKRVAAERAVSVEQEDVLYATFIFAWHFVLLRIQDRINECVHEEE